MSKATTVIVSPAIHSRQRCAGENVNHLFLKRPLTHARLGKALEMREHIHSNVLIWVFTTEGAQHCLTASISVLGAQ